MNPDIRLVVLDIDGTISGHANEVSEEVKATVKRVQAKGVKVAIATGRMYRSALRFHRAIAADMPLISYQGALIKDPQTNQVVGHWPVAPVHARTLLDDFTPYSDELSIHIYLNDELYVRAITPQTQTYAERSQIEPIVVGDLYAFLEQNPEPTKVLALSDNPSVITVLLEQLQDRYTADQLYLTKSVATYFEATNPIANKGTAVKFMAEELLGLTREQVLVVGDNFNDREMIAYAGIGVAMGDAPAALKAEADWVAPSVEDHGAAVALERFVLS
jgi:Cof subfamily protein (haloacid dehalogenase superfamily)